MAIHLSFLPSFLPPSFLPFHLSFSPSVLSLAQLGFAEAFNMQGALPALECDGGGRQCPGPQGAHVTHIGIQTLVKGNDGKSIQLQTDSAKWEVLKW